jgi:RimJ/RimL family protein N-acetyltransferase
MAAPSGELTPHRWPREPACVGAIVRDGRNRVYVQRRTPWRRLLPGTWDIIGGHLEAGETPQQALARELEEETGWQLRHIEAVIADWEWEHGGVVRRELDYLIEVDGDLGAPRLEAGKHDAYAWVGPGDLELLLQGRTDGDRRLRDIVAKAVRMRLTQRLRLEPVGPEHAQDLWRLHHDEAVAAWYRGRWSVEAAQRRATAFRQAWEAAGAGKWMAYDRHTGELVGRGGLGRLDADTDTAHRITALLPPGRWARERLEVGWALRAGWWGRGYATEIGRAGLRLAFEDLGAEQVVAFTERHNRRSRAVMERLGMRYVGEFPHRGLVEGLDGLHDNAPFALYTIAQPGLLAFRENSSGSLPSRRSGRR